MLDEYKKKVSEELNAKGYSPGELVSKYPEELKKLMIAHGLGDFNLNLAPAAEGEHFLIPIAKGWQELVATWPLNAVVAGIELPVLDESIVFYQEIDGIPDYDIPTHMLTESLCNRLVKYDAGAICDLPEHALNEEIYLTAVRYYGAYIFNVPEQKRTKRLWHEALLTCGDIFFEMDAEDQTRENLLIACKNPSLHLISELIIRSIMDNELANMIASNNDQGVTFKIYDIPTEFHSSEFYELWVRRSPHVLYEIPPVRASRKLIELAITQDGTLLKAVHPSQIDKKLILLAVQQSSSAVACVPKHLMKFVPENIIKHYEEEGKYDYIPF